MEARRLRSGRFAAVAAAVAVACASADARADEPAPSSSAVVESDRPVVVWPTLTPAGDDVAGMPLHKPAATEGSVYTRSQELDATLRDAVQDLGYTLGVADPGPTMGHARDLDLVERAKHSSARGREDDQGTWVVSARL